MLRACDRREERQHLLFSKTQGQTATLASANLNGRNGRPSVCPSGRSGIVSTKIPRTLSADGLASKRQEAQADLAKHCLSRRKGQEAPSQHGGPISGSTGCWFAQCESIKNRLSWQTTRPSLPSHRFVYLSPPRSDLCRTGKFDARLSGVKG